MTEHPLTDEICLDIDDNSMIDEDDWMGYMRAGADWQMDQAIRRFQDWHLKTHGWSTAIIELERLLRPTTTQEDN